MTVRIRSLSVLLGVGAVVAATFPAVAMDTTSTELTAKSAAPTTTTLTLHVDSCERCPITLDQALQGRRGVWESPTGAWTEEASRSRFRPPGPTA